MEGLRQQVRMSQGQVYSRLQRQELAILQCDYLHLEQELSAACRDNPILEERSAASCPFYSLGGGRRLPEGREMPFEAAERPADPRGTLKEQVGLDLPEDIAGAVAALIDCLDDRGFLRMSAREVCRHLSLTDDTCRKALAYLRRMGQGGIGCKDPGEYLAFQLKRQKRPLNWQKLCRENLSWVALRQYALICETYGMEMNEAKRCCAHIATLDPFPLKGAGEAEPPIAVRPELRIDRKDGAWHCELTEPLSERYELSGRLREYRTSCLSPEECAYVQENVTKARFLLAALRRREATLLLIGRLIISRQEGFLCGGAMAACPQSEAARALGLHPSTLSRALREKYLLLSGGLYPLSSFFPADGGGGLSRKGVQDLIEGLLKEAGDRRLSDRRIADMLEARHGIELSRRTVAKYRSERNLPSGYYK